MSWSGTLEYIGWFGVWGALVIPIGCLEAFDEGSPVQDGSYGPADLAPEDAPRVDESNAEVDGFTTQIRYLQGFSDGSPVAYWRMDGSAAPSISPVWRLEDDGGFIGMPIVDALPGDPGYSPFWRLHTVQVTDAYRGEQIWSREAITLGVADGILQQPTMTDTIFVAPIVTTGITFETKTGSAESTDIWYRNQKAAWVRFPELIRLPDDVRLFPETRAYVFQRINQPYILDEDIELLDLDGDAEYTSTHQVF
ncbi:MAG: hypothetical protein KTR25_19305, partial [Myxococcales bacterium]|nr:hypothetical protein [Myxococcales bacterium]